MRNALVLLFLSPLFACGGATATSPQTGDGGIDQNDGSSVGPQSSCPTGDSTCGGACTDLQSNEDNCGRCGNACAPMERCQRGTCAFIGCYPELDVCDGICSALSAAATCGSCGTACTGGQLCSLHECVDSCASGQTACGGACVDLAIDPYNCGACGTACDLSCVAGHCTSACPAGSESCVAGCRDVKTDPLNCGICSNACAPGEACSDGKCVAATR